MTLPAWRRTILLVEDEPFVREATASMLTRAGFEVVCAEDAASARAIYEEYDGHFDLLMTDMVLPGCSGKQLGRDLRLCSPELAVLVTSGYSNLEETEEGAGSRNYFLAKPYSRRSLLEKVEMIFARFPLERSAIRAV